jgi:phosphatidylinositol-3-phosphatase
MTVQRQSDPASRTCGVIDVLRKRTSRKIRSSHHARHLTLGLLVAALSSVPVLAAPISTVFVIAMENHDFTQPGSYTAIQPLLGNVAAPYLNSLVTPGDSNATNTSYFSQMLNVAPGIHPSEPNYIWQNGGSNFGVLADSDPSAAAHNIESATSFTGQLTAKGISWNSYQEDAQFSPTGGTTSASGTNPGYTNPFNDSHQYNYAVKHNPMAFFTDSNANPAAYRTFAQLQTDIANNTYAQYNWITPDQYNDMHSALTGGFTYNGTTYTGDQAAVAQGDNFLSLLVPQLEGTTAFENGTAMIEIWDDESEGGDTSAFDIPEIIISKDAVGNALDVAEPLTHSADLLTDEEIFQTGSCLLAACTSPDLAAAFLPGTIPDSVPEPATLGLFGLGAVALRALRRRRTSKS